jgi:hypothetical protein
MECGNGLEAGHTLHLSPISSENTLPNRYPAMWKGMLLIILSLEQIMACGCGDLRRSLGVLLP